MAADGDDDGKKIVAAVEAHPTMGPRLRAMIAR
jgi:hypothetical protein